MARFASRFALRCTNTVSRLFHLVFIQVSSLIRAAFKKPSTPSAYFPTVLLSPTCVHRPGFCVIDHRDHRDHRHKRTIPGSCSTDLRWQPEIQIGPNRQLDTMAASVCRMAHSIANRTHRCRKLKQEAMPEGSHWYERITNNHRPDGHPTIKVHDRA
ncbi:uncharacterized protein BDZ83DRAFT_211121 [Colletotrichum acutatum]|uniref:Uncharacterized protein n=1 Tax=Glomerella acutata TaxID=27357 RepID=A0AAD8XJ68_GLOAC|nr:uncharacterized protein BDZ83DRAFT_211121 [Colletotrichum acutatum]KAK1727303.1 hypothetical protein BDZ83DRAFT_211121 [Colletotrichum acutatum]